jgi:hypothetical protein
LENLPEWQAAAIKDMFKDVLEEVMQAKLENELGYEK